MKIVLLAAALLVSQVVVSQIKNSAFEARHQNVIQSAIADQCGLRGATTLASTSEKSVRVDQGIRDIYYTTELNVQDTVDQYSFFDFKVIVDSVKFDMYDHTTHDWGSYSVISVSCMQK